MRFARSRASNLESGISLKVTTPVTGWINPANRRINVDLPEPLAPMSAPILPCGKASDTSTITGVTEYAKLTSRASIRGVTAAPALVVLVSPLKSSLLIRERLRVDRLSENFRGATDKLARVNQHGIIQRVDAPFTNGAHFRKLAPHRHRILA